MVAVPAVLLVFGVAASIIVGVAKSPEWFLVIFTVTLMLSGPWLAIASNASQVRESDTPVPPPLPAIPPPLPQRYADIMAEAQRRKAKQAEVDALLHEQERTIQLLNEARCFYKNENEQIGPVSFWRVRELIEMDLLTPDVQVIAEGSDYWRSYAEWEIIVVPPRGQTTFAKFRKAAHMSCFYLDQDREVGPISLLAIFHYIRAGKLSPEVHVRATADENWVPASQV